MRQKKTKDDVALVKHIWDEDNDRWMYLEYNMVHKIIGLNFMQGDEYDCFKKSWCISDEGLTNFYHQMRCTFEIEEKSVNTVEFINKCMWSYHCAIRCYEEDNCNEKSETTAYGTNTITYR